MTTDKITLFWFRQDLRLQDNPGLFAAAQNGPVMPIYILDDVNAGDNKMGAASRWWLNESLNSLNDSLLCKLNVYSGDSLSIIQEILRENSNITAVYWSRCYQPWRISLDSRIKAQLCSNAIEVKSFNASLLWEPWEVLKSDSQPYKVFTPYYRKGCLEQAPPPRQTVPVPPKLDLIKDSVNAITIQDLKLLPSISWHTKMQDLWSPGQKGAAAALAEFLNNGLQEYKEGRNFPDKKNVSKLSPHLHFGELSPHQVWQDAEFAGMAKSLDKDLDHFLSELGWREFSYYLLYHFPELPHRNFQKKFDNFPWQDNQELLKKWQKGMTGYPLVDAGMRQLWQTGYIHNRVRMVVASFLVKNLLIHWRHGERWFWDCLVDADLASNSASWQWVAGSGCDAAPYFRIFNPTLQGEKFDSDGAYTRHFVPELRNLASKFLFKPFAAPLDVLNDAGIILGQTYPHPIVNLDESRQRTLQAYQSL
jgi:deoxyribodipyrimidine photo-lyase